MSSARSSFESDLKAAREAANVSVEDIQRETRIPIDVIERFEEGRLIGDPAFNSVYLKAFLTAYAEAIGLSSSKVTGAFEELMAGGYRGQLGDRNVEDFEDTEEKVEPAEEEKTEEPEEDAQPAWVPRENAGAPVHIPSVETKPTARLRSTNGRFDTAWGLIGGVAVLVVAAVFFILWLIFRNPDPADEPALSESVEDNAIADTSVAVDQAVEEPESGPPLQLPIRISVVAGGDGLQGFRATQAPDARRPYWVAFGEELVLESNEEVILWGEGAQGMQPEEVMLRFQGYEWRPEPGQILRINRNTGQALLDSLHNSGLIPAGQ
ncbi:MAG: helix-turn-helix transcriptional regulator [Rubricoccaceae bacterium]|nr:helix-turn-helix transcriptional regulator [Rubricoccaceae bacterium]